VYRLVVVGNRVVDTKICVEMQKAGVTPFIQTKKLRPEPIAAVFKSAKVLDATRSCGVQYRDNHLLHGTSGV
jgi:hypothetical protein